MKRILILLLAMVMCCSLFGCGETESAGTDAENSQTVTNNSASTTETEMVQVTEAATESSQATEITEATQATEATEATENTTATQPIHTHNWKDATCTLPKTCITCGETTGIAAGHIYTNGKCSVCSKEDPSVSQEPMVWIPTKGGTKYHSNSGCSNMDGPIGVPRSYALSQGFTACKRCY